MDNYISDANKYMEEAKAELSKANWFFNRINKSKAIELMVKSGDSYALGKDYESSINSYFECLTLINNSPELLLDYTTCRIVLLYIERCNTNKNPINNIAHILLRDKGIINYLQQTKSYNVIIAIYAGIAINYELFNNIDDALYNYQIAIDYADLSKMTALTIKFLKKIAELNVKNNKNIVASKNYRDCGELCLTSDLLRFNARTYLLYSLILKVEECSEEQMKEKIIECTNIDPKFANSPEYNLIYGLVLAYKVKNDDYFNKVITNNVQIFDTHIIQLLEKIKNNIVNQ